MWAFDCDFQHNGVITGLLLIAFIQYAFVKRQIATSINIASASTVKPKNSFPQQDTLLYTCNHDQNMSLLHFQ